VDHAKISGSLFSKQGTRPDICAVRVELDNSGIALTGQSTQAASRLHSQEADRQTAKRIDSAEHNIGNDALLFSAALCTGRTVRIRNVCASKLCSAIRPYAQDYNAYRKVNSRRYATTIATIERGSQCLPLASQYGHWHHMYPDPKSAIPDGYSLDISADPILAFSPS
jgi:hypothetical protein